MKIWQTVERFSPVDGIPVLTLSPGGMEQVLIRSGELWFLSDRSMYVYYTPEKWTEIEEEI